MWSYQVRCITGHHLKLVQIRNIFMKQAENLSTVMYLSLFDINSNLQLDNNIYNSLLYNSWIQNH